METAEQRELRSLVKAFFSKVSTIENVRRLMLTPGDFDRDTWLTCARELGLQGLAIPEEFGGGGATPQELGIVFEQLGADLYGAPFLATVGFAATLLTEFPDSPVSGKYLPGIADGSITATVAWGGTEPLASTISLWEANGTTTVNGVAETVVDASSADLLLVITSSAAGPQLVAVDGDGFGVTRTVLRTLDQTRSLARIEFSDASATEVCARDVAAAGIARAMDLATLYLAAEGLGGAERILANTLDYAKTRYQFGRAIGSFQAVKHRCADLYIEVQLARSVVEHGLWTAVHAPDELGAAALLARSIVSEAHRKVAIESVQIHGGIGFTWEHAAHLYLKRAKSNQLLLQSPGSCRHRLAELEGIFADVDQGKIRPAMGASSASALSVDVESFLATHEIADATDLAADQAFREARFDAGLAFVHFDVGSGGRGVDPAEQVGVESRFQDAGAADHLHGNVIALGMALPTIHAHGTPEQKKRFLRRGFSGQDIWCQLFSEPGAGSDLAGLATRAELDGDHFVVNGQKVWTSLGHLAARGLLLARTDPNVPKHKGLTYFLLDMNTLGVEVRPLRQLTGEAEFNEVYLTDVRIPVTDVLGTVGEGWSIAMTTLSNERVTLGARPIGRGEGPIATTIASFRKAHAAGRTSDAHVESLMLLWTRSEAARLTNERASAQTGRAPGPEGSAAKLLMADLNKAMYEMAVDLEGSDSLVFDYDLSASEDPRPGRAYLRSLANSIEGGTSEVLRNVLGERVLGLPGEPRVDNRTAWKDTKRA